MSAAAARAKAPTGAFRFFGYAAVSLVVYALLGIRVSTHAPSGFDRAYAWFVGAAQPLAILFTRSCLWYVLVPLAIAAIVLGALAPAWRGRAFGSVVLTLVMWTLSNVLKDVFRRPRPDDWRWVHEASYAYSSGHAMFAVVVYGMWAWFVYRSDLPDRLRAAAAIALLLWACGVVWSRLALGAHYPTDLVGGILLGGAGVAIFFGIMRAVRMPVDGTF